MFKVCGELGSTQISNLKSVGGNCGGGQAGTYFISLGLESPG